MGQTVASAGQVTRPGSCTGRRTERRAGCHAKFGPGQMRSTLAARPALGALAPREDTVTGARHRMVSVRRNCGCVDPRKEADGAEPTSIPPGGLAAQILTASRKGGRRAYATSAQPKDDTPAYMHT